MNDETISMPLQAQAPVALAQAEQTKANKLLKSGNYAYRNLAYKQVRVTPSGAVYVIQPDGQWHRERGKAATDLVNAMVDEVQKAEAFAKAAKLPVAA